MNKYTVTISNDKDLESISMKFPLPKRLASSGDTYETTIPFLTLANIEYFPGDRFYIIDRTNVAPHHRSSSLGNLLIRCKNRTSVWTEFDAGIATGMFKLI